MVGIKYVTSRYERAARTLISGRFHAFMKDINKKKAGCSSYNYSRL